MSDSRTQNSKRNIIIGLFRQVLSIVLAFASRTMVLYLLGEQYLGLSSLFTAILSVLSLADLGFTAAVVYLLYKPIAENDNEEICAIVAYLKQVYGVIGAVILAVGLLVMPFLPALISGGYPSDINIYILYAIYLVNTVLSYWFFAYKSVLFTAMQRADIVDKVYSAASLAVKAVQLLLLVAFRNYYLFALVMPLGTLVNNLLLQHFSRKFMPQMVPRGQLSAEKKASVNRQVRALFIGKVGDVARNSCDSIILSALLGLSVVAAYDNYIYIYNSVIGVVWMIGNAVQASVGNSMVKESLEKNRQQFFLFDFLFAWFNGWCAICLCCLYQPFMTIWMDGNQEMMLSDFNMALISLYFYSVSINNVRNIYVNGAGLFAEMKTWYIMETVGNLVLNLLLGHFFGVTGIIVATLITVFLFNFIARSNVLFRCYFNSPVCVFYQKHLLYFLVMVLGCIVTGFVCSFVPFDGFVGLLLRAAICVVVPNLVFLAAYSRTESFRKGIRLGKAILKSS